MIITVMQNGDQMHDGADSTVFIPRDGNFVTKTYHKDWGHQVGYPSVEEEDLLLYSSLHQLLSLEGSFSFRLPSKTNIQNLGLLSRRIDINFLDIGDDIYTENGFLKHRIPKVEGIPLVNGVINPQRGFKEIHFIEQKVSQHVASILGINHRIIPDLNHTHIVGVNLLVTKNDKAGIRATVTDIGASIFHLMRLNSDRIDALLREKGILITLD